MGLSKLIGRQISKRANPHHPVGYLEEALQVSELEEILLQLPALQRTAGQRQAGHIHGKRRDCRRHGLGCRKNEKAEPNVSKDSALPAGT